MVLRQGIDKRFAIVSWVLVALWACFIFSMSAHTSTDLSEGFFEQVKEFLKGAINSVIGYHEDPVSPFCHFCEYALFGLLLANALHCHMSWGKACLIAVACASAYGVTDEIHQLFVPGRMCDPADWATDTCGAALGAFVYYVLSAPSRRRSGLKEGER